MRWTEARDRPHTAREFTCPRSVIGVDYEVRGLASGRRHYFSKLVSWALGDHGAIHISFVSIPVFW